MMNERTDGRLLAALADRPLLLDGGMGTRLMALGLDLTHDDPALWNLFRPEAVRDVHARDVAAGADCVVTNTFGANPSWLDRFGRSAVMAAINRRAVELARIAAGTDRFVLGSIGPTAGDRPVAYRAQAEVLLAAGVDGLLLETHQSRRALAGLGELRGISDAPILVSLSCFDGPVADEARRLDDAGADALGVNCVAPARALAWVAEIAAALPSHRPLLCKPAASHPRASAFAPLGLAGEVPGWLEQNVRLLGGCCGTDDGHVAAMRSALDGAMAGRV